MKDGIHPKYGPAVIRCACGNVIETRSTKPEIRVEICSKCHPFFTMPMMKLRQAAQGQPWAAFPYEKEARHGRLPHH